MREPSARFGRAGTIGLLLKSDETWGCLEEAFWRTWGCPAPLDTPGGGAPAQYLQIVFYSDSRFRLPKARPVL